MTDNTMRYYRPAGSLASAGVTADVVPDGKELSYAGLTVKMLAAGETFPLNTEQREHVVLPLKGAVEVIVDGAKFQLNGRDSVWHLSDVLYVPIGVKAQLVATDSAEIALPWANATRGFPIQYLGREAIPVELRGAGICSREVRNFAIPGVIDADRLIACEVLTPGGNWSSYPPHKHDTLTDAESQLEEIYFYKVAPSPTGAAGFGIQRVYSSSAGDIDITEAVGSDDVILIPFGYHGPSIAAPGHDLYYLNVMAGPARDGHVDRAWTITDDPQHTWLRQSWQSEAIDSRLPFGE